MEPQLLVYRDAEAAVEALAHAVVGTLAGAVARRGEARLALSGGSTPKALHRRLATGEFAAQVPWNKVDIVFGDERCVPPADPHSNFRMARETLLDHLPVPPRRVLAVDGTLPPEVAAARYSEAVSTLPLDLVLLGLGDDGHTASLFPGGTGFSPSDPVAVAALAPAHPRHRVSLSLATLRGARSLLFLVLGRPKVDALRAVLAQYALAEGPSTLPAARVRPPGGQVAIYADAEAMDGI
ncbi:MAG: 6-phosphogluconolactonase [Planctomycetaceae bacterium]|nr:6-phosphogluconolactonase [Planctomycetaceae bacterium]